MQILSVKLAKIIQSPYDVSDETVITSRNIEVHNEQFEDHDDFCRWCTSQSTMFSINSYGSSALYLNRWCSQSIKVKFSLKSDVVGLFDVFLSGQLTQNRRSEKKAMVMTSFRPNSE